MKNINFIIILILITILVYVFYSIFTSNRTAANIITAPDEVVFEVENIDTSVSDTSVSDISIDKSNKFIAAKKVDVSTVNLVNNEEIVFPGKYVDYEGKNNLSLAAQEGSAVLFFHAAWCPTCRSLERAIKNEESNIPNGLTIFKVDYDSESELKRMYKVTYQHTLVQVDSSLNEISKWTGSRDLDAIVSKVQ